MVSENSKTKNKENNIMDNEIKIEDVMKELHEVKNTLKADREAFEAEKRAFDKEKAEYDGMNPGQKESKKEWRGLADAIMEKRAIQVSGTGIVETVPELIRLVKNRNVAAGQARYFRGPRTGFTIPLVSAYPAAPTKQSEGATSITVDSTAALTYKSLTPVTYMSILPVTWEQAKYSVVSEAEILQLLADSFSDAIETNLLSSSSSGDIKGIFASAAVASGNKTTCAAAGYATLAEVYAFAGKLKGKTGNYEIWLPVEQLSALMAESTSDYNFVKEEIAHKGTIRGIKVNESNNITASTSSGATLVLGTDLSSNYGIVWADDLEIRPVVNYNSSLTYYQGIQGLAGDVINPNNNFALVAHA